MVEQVRLRDTSGDICPKLQGQNHSLVCILSSIFLIHADQCWIFLFEFLHLFLSLFKNVMGYIWLAWSYQVPLYYFYFFYNLGYPDQLTCTTTNSRTHWTSCKPSRQARHRGDDWRAHKDSKLECRDRKFPVRTARPRTWVLLSSSLF
jgi:hypothetical protein